MRAPTQSDAHTRTRVGRNKHVGNLKLMLCATYKHASGPLGTQSHAPKTPPNPLEPPVTARCA
jgi:hypothetical protein